LSERYEDVENLRAENGFEDYTFRAALQAIDDAKAPVRASKALNVVHKCQQHAAKFPYEEVLMYPRVSEFSSKIWESA